MNKLRLMHCFLVVLIDEEHLSSLCSLSGKSHKRLRTAKSLAVIVLVNRSFVIRIRIPIALSFKL